jgi:hypothetical protein
MTDSGKELLLSSLSSFYEKNDEYLQIVNESMGAFTEEENIENINKIIKNVAKEVIIEKEI